MTKETYRLVENIHPLYIINYIFFFLHPCIQLPIIPTQSLLFFHASAYYSTSLSYISLFLFLFHHFSHDSFISSYCCCLPTPMTHASGGSPMFPLVVHQPASPSIWPAVQSLRRGLSTNPGATMWCVCGCS